MSRLYIVTLLFNSYAEYIMWNAGWDEAQTGIKITGRNINNLRYPNDTTFMAESEEELRLLIFLPAVLIPACASSSLAFHMMYSV